MKRRQESIIYQLAVSEGPLTTDELARRLSVSARTIKYEMIEVRSVLPKYGAELFAKRNEGYSIRVRDRELFDRYIEPLSLQSGLTNNFGSDDNARFLYIARKLVSSSRYAKIEDIADELYLSRSAIREAVNSVMNFLKSYHLETESKPGLGIRTFGTEYHMRMAMTELFAVHFHKVLLDNAGMEYAKWTQCGYEERQEIRHVFLKVLRESRIKVTDTNTQRLAIYFIIVRNRCNAGYRIKLPDRWKEELKGTDEISVASEIYRKLNAGFAGFDLPEEETVFLAVYLMSCRDMWNVEQPQTEYALYYQDAKEMMTELQSYMKDICNIDLIRYPWARKELLNLLISLFISIHFGLESLYRFWYDYENQAFHSPVAAALACTAAGFLQDRLDIKISVSFYSQMASLFFKRISLTEYNIRPQKLLLVNSNGLGLNEILQKRIVSRYERLVDSFTIAELYEIRGMNQEEYDAVLTDTSEIAYHYDLPCCVIRTISSEKEMDLLFNRHLIKAYQTEGLIPREEQIEIIKNYRYTDELQFFQFLAFRHGKTEKERERILEFMERVSFYDMGYLSAKSVMLYVPASLCEKECIELYCLADTGSWRGKEVEYLLFLSADWKEDWKRVKALENSFRQLFSEYSNMKAFSERRRPVLFEMIEKCLKYE
ncbi:helix-turn-helix domain-containing protein [Clostridium boliviensis]|uniref:Helix-turn-helix domain-containing protein n=1 Tax=Clostridium boliviensis TaxID=318465 RepID=A0ABU4GLR7_9CLOT|nr:HTH domain-containing protein [Clostridium boliviensis]MDW2797940.1 helix-turn-helix domain-containing protein [Clostridium boliviensis]